MNCDALPKEHMRKICKGEIPFGDPEQHAALMQRWFQDLARERGLTRTAPVLSSPRKSRDAPGTGTLLSESITWLTGIVAENATCHCATLRDQMDQMGPDWCMSNREMLIDRVIANAKSLEAASALGAVSISMLKTDAGQWAARHVLRRMIAAAAKAAARQAGDSRIPRFGPPPSPFPFTAKPDLTLLFHVYPTDFKSLHRHKGNLDPVSHRFDRRIMGIAVGENTMAADEVMDIFGDEWEYVRVNNNPKLREVKTYRQMFKMLDGTNRNAVTFCAHGKGAQSHTRSSSAIKWWTDAMYRTVIHNVDGVLQTMEQGYSVAGSFRRWGRHLGVRHKYHFSGTFYAFRNSLVTNALSRLRSVWWGTESWPGDWIPFQNSACLFADDCGNMYFRDEQPRNELAAWLEDTHRNGDSAHRG